jgi:glycosyltransferase involved in cell wall biosynthesis
VVATRLATHTQVLDDTIAYLVDSSPEEMAKGLLYLAADKVERQNIASNARQRVQEEYSLPAFQRKLGSFYEKVQTIL